MTGEVIRSYRDLLVWQRGIDLVEEVYRATARWPSSETFGLAGQIQRVAVSIPSNISEGHGRGNDKELSRFVAIARGSHCELDTQLINASRLGYLSDVDLDRLTSLSSEVGRLLYGLSRRLQTDIQRSNGQQ